MRRLKALVLGILAGISIAIGGTVFLCLDNKVMGSFLFTIGLFSVCTMKFNLYTGKVCYVFDNDKDFAIDLIFIWLGNLIGTYLTAFLLSFTRIYPAMNEKALSLAETKLSDNLLSIFILSMFCNMLIYIAVEGFNNNPHEFGKYLALVFGIMVFILCGFEHCVANMYYFSVAKVWSLRTLGYVIVMTIGNSIGGLIIPLLRKLALKLDKK